MRAEVNAGASTDDRREGTGESETPALLIWERDIDSIDADAILEAQGEDWRYAIYPALGPDGDTVGYHVTGGDNDSGDDIGSVIIHGKKGELTLAEAKAAAEANYADRVREAEQLLDDLLGDWDDDGTQTRRSDDGRIICLANDLDIDGVESVVTLQDYVDTYDSATRRATVCLRTVLSYSDSGDAGGLVDFVRQLIRLDTGVPTADRLD